MTVSQSETSKHGPNWERAGVAFGTGTTGGLDILTAIRSARPSATRHGRRSTMAERLSQFETSRAAGSNQPGGQVSRVRTAQPAPPVGSQRHECDYCRRVDSDDEPASESWYWLPEGFWLCEDCCSVSARRRACFHA